MSGIKAMFDAAAVAVKKLKAKPEDEEMLSVYALFKQATTGDVDTEDPGSGADPAGKAKWGAWGKQRGKSLEDAMNQYVTLVDELKAKYGM